MKSGYIYVYDNGIINITAYTCPAGFNPGRINTLKKSKKIEETMHYGNIKQFSIENGEGVRVSLFVSGCRHHCKGCF